MAIRPDGPQIHKKTGHPRLLDRFTLAVVFLSENMAAKFAGLVVMGHTHVHSTAPPLFRPREPLASLTRLATPGLVAALALGAAACGPCEEGDLICGTDCPDTEVEVQIMNPGSEFAFPKIVGDDDLFELKVTEQRTGRVVWHRRGTCALLGGDELGDACTSLGQSSTYGDDTERRNIETVVPAEDLAPDVNTKSWR